MKKNVLLMVFVFVSMAVKAQYSLYQPLPSSPTSPIPMPPTLQYPSVPQYSVPTPQTRQQPQVETVWGVVEGAGGKATRVRLKVRANVGAYVKDINVLSAYNIATKLEYKVSMNALPVIDREISQYFEWYVITGMGTVYFNY